MTRLTCEAMRGGFGDCHRALESAGTPAHSTTLRGGLLKNAATFWSAAPLRRFLVAR